MFGAYQCGFVVFLDKTLHSHLVCFTAKSENVYRTVRRREGREWQYSRLVRGVERASESSIDEPT